MSGMFLIVLPAAILAGGAFLVYLSARIFRLGNKAEAVITVIVLACAFLTLVIISFKLPSLIEDPGATFGSSGSGGIIFRVNAVGIFILIVSVFIGIMVTIYSGEYLSKDPRYKLYYPLILLILAGLVGLFLSNDLFNLFLITEFITVTASALIAFRFYQEIAIKAGFKYLIMSSIGTMMMLLGIYFVFRSTGSMQLTDVLLEPNSLSRFGAAAFLLGFSLKAGVVPLHTWVPDVYGHAPSAVSGLLAGVVSKSMLFMIPVICLRLGMTRGELGAYLMGFACLNMLIGSIRMLRQPLLRRFLAFSSIGQTGYLMFALGVGLYYQMEQAISAGLFVFLIVAVMKCLAFLSAGAYEFHFGTQNMDRLSGAGLNLKTIGLTFSIALAGLAGIPLLAGFTGKWLIFSAAFTAGDVFSIICLVIFLLTSVISLGGYLPTIVKQFRQGNVRVPANVEKAENEKPSMWVLIPTMTLAALVVVIGIFPTPWLNLVDYFVQWMWV